MEFKTEIFSQFDKKWALLTAGTIDKYNAMTVSWGGLVTIWNKPVATVYVRTSRYTHEFMDDSEFFTISFFPQSHRKMLAVFGSESGRDMDKMHYEGLTSKEAGGSVVYEEAEITLVCRKLFKEHLSIDKIPADIVSAFYSDDAAHDMYIGEVVDILQ